MNTNALNNIYNFYLTTYSKDISSPFDSHKRSELKGLYNSMVKLNKEAPIFLMKNTRSTQAYAIGIKENARILRNSIASLGGLDDTTVLNKKAAFSEDDSIVTASFVGEHTASEEIPSFQIEIEALATGQTNRGEFLPSQGRVRLRPKDYSFDLHINDMNYEFQFSIGESETNRQIQERLCKLINNSGVGLSSSVIEDGNGNSALEISSVATGIIEGKEHLFYISDYKTSQAAGSVSYFGLNKIGTKAANARFYIDGRPHISYSNHFTVEKTYEITLKNTTAQKKAVTIGTKNDMESLVGNISHMIQGYNDFVRSVSEFDNEFSGNSKLLNEIKGITRHYENSFASLGLTVKEDNQIDINKEVLEENLDNEHIDTLFTKMKDFTSSLLRKTWEITLDPMKYVDKKVVAYKNPGKTFTSPYTTSTYSGMMFNFYC